MAANSPTYAAVAPIVDWVNRKNPKAPPLPEIEIEKIVRSIVEKEQRKRAMQARADLVITDNGSGPELSRLPDDERLSLAREIWSRFGVVCSDWYVLTSDKPEFVLVTPELEAIFENLLSPMIVRHRVAHLLHILMPILKAAAWEPIAIQLIKLAREEPVIDSRASETVGEWIEEYARAYKAREWEPGRRRDMLSGGPIVYDGRLSFRLAHFRTFIEAAYGEKLLPRQVASLLKRAGGTRERIRVTPEGDQARVWSLSTYIGEDRIDREGSGGHVDTE